MTLRFEDESAFREFERQRKAPRKPPPRSQPQAQPAVKGRARGVDHVGRMNGTEARYAREVLEPLKAGGVISDWRYEPQNFQLAAPFKGTDGKTVKGVYFRPDFLVVMADGGIEYHEVKGARVNRSGKKTGHFEDDARVKWKVAAQLFPWFTWRAVWRVAGVWQEEARGDFE